MRTFDWDNGADITPSDTVNLTTYAVGLHVKTAAGLVNVVHVDDTVQDYYINKGDFLPCPVKRVNATGTAATGIVGLYWSQ